MDLHNLHPNDGSHRRKKRLGRGHGSGRGKTGGRGTKGQNARNGGGWNPRFEGGQTPIHLRLPHRRGFKNPFRVEYQVVNLDRIALLFPDGGAIGVEELVAKGAVRDDRLVKVLGGGELGVKLDVTVHAFSASAKDKLAAAGGSATEL